jgi:hypothetical protein
MWLQEPGSFTRIIAAMVAPRNTSSDTMRPGRAVSAAVRAFEAGAAMVSAVAMVRPSNGGDSTAPQRMPQRSGPADDVLPELEMFRRITSSAGGDFSPEASGPKGRLDVRQYVRPKGRTACSNFSLSNFGLK